MITQSNATQARRRDHESIDPDVSGRSCGDGGCGSPGAAPASTARLRRGSGQRGLLWIAGGFLFCPCHLPLTLAALGAVLSGTVAGTALRAHPIATGVLITGVWLLATWRGLRLLRSEEG